MNKRTIKNRRQMPVVATIMAMAMAPFFVACDSYDNATGKDLMPDYNIAASTSYSLPLTFKTISADSKNQATNYTGVSYNNIYVNSSYGYVGSIPNKPYGGTSCEYLTQFYCPQGFTFAEKPLENRIDSAFVVLSYADYTGRGASPLQVSAYRLKSALPFNKYSIDDVSPYVDLDEAHLLGSTTYTAEKGSEPGSNIRRIKIPMPQALGQEFYDKSKAKSSEFSSQEHFDQYFSGVYLKTTAGEGSIVRIARTSLAFYYSVPDTLTRPSTGAKDSIVTVAHTQYLSHTIEVPQISRFSNENIDKLMSDDSNYAYIKSPAGVFTEITIPTVEINKILNGAKEGYVRQLNSVPIVITGEGETANDFALSGPSDLILMPTDSVASFFAKELNEKDAPYSTYVSSKTSKESKTYSFGNIVQLVKRHIKDHPDRDLKVTIVPILKASQSNTNSYSPTTEPTAISNLILPSAMKISTGKENNKLKIVVTETKKGSPF